MSLGVLLLYMYSSLTAACCNLGVTHVSWNIYCKVMPTPSKIYLIDRVDSQSQYLIILQNYIISTKILPQIKQQIFSVIHSCYGKQVRVVGGGETRSHDWQVIKDTYIHLFVNNDVIFFYISVHGQKRVVRRGFPEAGMLSHHPQVWSLVHN